jgi:hypothetical protein
LSDVEHPMLVSAQTGRLLLRKNAPRTDKSKEMQRPLDAVVNRRFSASKTETHPSLWKLPGAPPTIRVKAQYEK